MAVPKAEIVSTGDISTRGLYEESATQASSSEDQRIPLVALDALQTNREGAESTIPESLFDKLPGSVLSDFLSDLLSILPPRGRVSLEQTSRSMRLAVNAHRVQEIASFLNEPGLERLLSYFCPQSIDRDRLGVFESLRHDLLTKVLPDVCTVLRGSTYISDDEKKELCTHSPEAIVGNPRLLCQVLQAAYDNSLVSFVADGHNEDLTYEIEPPQLSLPTLKEKARITKGWLEVRGSSIKNFCVSVTDYRMTCLPEEICALTNLYHLSVEKQLIRTLPHSIGNLRKLVCLSFDHNQLVSLPPEIRNLSSLYLLNLNHNQLVSLPSEIGNLIDLDCLFLSNNRLVSLPSEIGNLFRGNPNSPTNWLNLAYNQLVSLPPEMGNLSSLRCLNLAHNQLVSLPQEMGNLRNLSQLELEGNPVTAHPKTLRGFIVLGHP